MEYLFDGFNLVDLLSNVTTILFAGVSLRCLFLGYRMLLKAAGELDDSKSQSSFFSATDDKAIKKSIARHYRNRSK